MPVLLDLYLLTKSFGLLRNALKLDQPSDEESKNKRPMGHKAHQSSSSKLPSPAFWTGMMIRAC